MRGEYHVLVLLVLCSREAEDVGLMVMCNGVKLR
jgi:hypothetical protein